jgi:hypothetical protein
MFSTGGIAFIFLAGWLLTLPACFLILWRYRKAVLASMLTAKGRAFPPDVDSGATGSRKPELRLQFIDAAAAPPAASPNGVNTRASSGPGIAAIVYAVAGLVYAVIATIALFSIEGFEFLPIRTATVVLVFFWPAVLAVLSVAVASRRSALAAVAAYFLLGTLLAWENAGHFVKLWAIEMGIPSFFVLSVSNRRFRGAGPLVLVFMILLVTGANLGLNAAWEAAQSGVLATKTLIALVTVVCGLAAWVSIRWLARSYARKGTSDQMLSLDAQWLLFTLHLCLSLANTAGSFGLAGIAAFAGYKVTQRLAFAQLAKRRGRRKNVRILLLRVFGSKQRSERLLDQFGLHWRHAGSIQLIAGTDLATANLEPHEFVSFLSGRLARSFIGSAEQLNQRIAAVDDEPDPDGRFRVNEFFCHDNAWQMVLRRLIHENEAVLMDLRSFTPQRRGCVFELTELVNSILLSRVVLLVDGTTNLDFLKQTLNEAWQGMNPRSPNRDGAAVLSILQFKGQSSSEVRHLVGAVAAAVPAR